MRMQSLLLKILNSNKLLVLKRNYAVPVQQQEIVQLTYLKDEDAGVAVINLSDVKDKNTFTQNLLSALNERFNAVAQSDARVLILKSDVPKIFCVGGNLKERLKMPEKDVATFVSYARATVTRLQNLPLPVIAALDGTALGGGLELALGCDLRVAASNIRLGLVETRLAIIPGAGGTVRLPRLINPALAKELIFTAKVFDGSEAKEMGVVNHVVEPNEESNSAYLRSLEIARTIVPNGPIGVRMAKFTINKGLEVDINAALSFEEACYAQVIPTEDRIEGLKAFQEKRRPKYVGK